MVRDLTEGMRIGQHYYHFQDIKVVVSFPANNNYFNVFLCFFWSRDLLGFESSVTKF